MASASIQRTHETYTVVCVYQCQTHQWCRMRSGYWLFLPHRPQYFHLNSHVQHHPELNLCWYCRYGSSIMQHGRYMVPSTGKPWMLPPLLSTSHWSRSHSLSTPPSTVSSWHLDYPNSSSESEVGSCTSGYYYRRSCASPRSSWCRAMSWHCDYYRRHPGIGCLGVGPWYCI